MKKRWECFALALALLCGLATGRAFGQGTPFVHEDVSFTIPEGWVSQDIPDNFEKETAAWLKSEKFAGGSFLVFCYKGWRHNYNNVRIAALKTLSATAPQGQEMLKKPEKIWTEKGLTAHWEYWRLAVEGIFLEAPIGILENNNGWILILGFAPAASGTQLEEDFMKIVQTIE